LWRREVTDVFVPHKRILPFLPFEEAGGIGRVDYVISGSLGALNSFRDISHALNPSLLSFWLVIYNSYDDLRKKCEHRCSLNQRR